jgi:spore germination cell wall hydrolase CwlJ-like protein
VFSAAASIQLATYSFARPIGTSAPESANYRLASLERPPAMPGVLTHNRILRVPPRYQASDFPKVDRTLKGDRLVVAPPSAPAEAAPSLENPTAPTISVEGTKTAALPSGEAAKLDPELEQALSAPPLPQYDVSLSLEAQPPGDLVKAPDILSATPATAQEDAFDIKTVSLYFGTNALGGALEGLEQWQPGDEPLIVSPAAQPDPDMKGLSLTPDAAKASANGESVVPKGAVNDQYQQSRTPAERLGLADEKTRAKAEKCLAEAVYFEARGEAVRGQIAVAQVVMNRAFSGYYPTTVCGVVYQNKYRHFACQFTFACDKTPDIIREPDMWERAKKIAKAMLDGLIWLPEVGKSTHYHAYYVHPSWVSEMKRTYRFGVHTFYRPKAWGDGSDSPSWGTPQQTAAISAELAAEAHSEAEMYPNSVRR